MFVGISVTLGSSPRPMIGVVDRFHFFPVGIEFTRLRIRSARPVVALTCTQLCMCCRVPHTILKALNSRRSITQNHVGGAPLHSRFLRMSGRGRNWIATLVTDRIPPLCIR